MTITSDFWALVKEWQTLVSGILAIAGAAIGALLLYLQLRQERRRELERRRRQHSASRSMLPIALSAITEYIESIARDLRRIRAESGDHEVQIGSLTAWKPPPIPDVQATMLTEVIESASDEIAEVLSELLRQLQVQTSRIRFLRTRAAAQHHLSVHELKDNIRYAARIYALSASLFSYARRESDAAQSEITDKDKRAALRAFGFPSHEIDELIPIPPTAEPTSNRTNKSIIRRTRDVVVKVFQKLWRPNN